MGTLPKDCALLGGNGNILKIKTRKKEEKEKKTLK
jgi:hypothetical protein